MTKSWVVRTRLGAVGTWGKGQLTLFETMLNASKCFSNALSPSLLSVGRKINSVKPPSNDEKCAIDHILDAQTNGEINEDNVLYIVENINVAGQDRSWQNSNLIHLCRFVHTSSFVACTHSFSLMVSLLAMDVSLFCMCMQLLRLPCGRSNGA